MSDNLPDLEALAKRFLDLWQDQVAASLSAAASPIDPAPGDPGEAAKHGAPRNETAAFVDAFAAMAAGAAPLAASFGAGDGRVDELTRRLAACERRLSALESGAGESGGKPRRRARKRAG